MKKILAIMVLASSLLLVGCGDQSKYEDTMKDYATTFYNNYLKGNEGLPNPYQVSIQQLKDANEQVQAGFDLTPLEKCTDDSYVELVLDENTKDVQDVKFFLQCE